MGWRQREVPQGVEFRLGGQDHVKIEDFLARGAEGVSAIVLHPKLARHQGQAAGVQVVYDPATERCVAPGYALPDNPYGDELLNVDHLAATASARHRLLDEVIRAHPTGVTQVTPPHFLVNDERTASLNVALAADARQHVDGDAIRATVLLSRSYAIKDEAAADLTIHYAQAGVTRLELRITPLGGERESIAKIKSVFAILDHFKNAGIEVTLGSSGNIGHAAVALGHADHYSVGVGLGERVNHASALSRQQAPPPPPTASAEKSRQAGAVSGIYLPGIAATVSRAAGAALLAHTDIQTRVGCRTDACAFAVNNPAVDPRGHYLHARAREMADLLAKPTPWRATREIDRLQRALTLRSLINTKHPLDGVPELQTRTIRSLLDDLQLEQAARSA